MGSDSPALHAVTGDDDRTLGALTPVWGDSLPADPVPELGLWRERSPGAVMRAVDGSGMLGLVLGRSLAAGYRVEQLHVRDAPDGRALPSLLAAVAAWRPAERIEILVAVDEEDDVGLDDVLAAAGFARVAALVEYELDLQGRAPAPPQPRRLTYRRFEEVGRHGVAAVLERIWAAADTPTGRPPAAELDDFVHAARGTRDRPDTSLWRVAYHRGALAGVVLAYRTEGTGVLQYFGLVPEAHGLGLGRAMHVDALRLLRSAGATRYHDSTRVDNAPMRRIFASSGCEVSGYTRLYARGERPEWRPPGRLPVVPRGAHVSLLRKA